MITNALNQSGKARHVMRTRVLRRPIVFLRIRCSIHIHIHTLHTHARAHGVKIWLCIMPLKLRKMNNKGRKVVSLWVTPIPNAITLASFHTRRRKTVQILACIFHNAVWHSDNPTWDAQFEPGVPYRDTATSRLRLYFPNEAKFVLSCRLGGLNLLLYVRKNGATQDGTHQCHRMSWTTNYVPNDTANDRIRSEHKRTVKTRWPANARLRKATICPQRNNQHYMITVGRDSSVGTATHYGLDYQAIKYREGVGGGGSRARPQRSLGPTGPPYNGYWIFPGVELTPPPV
jgi:hypothetical protein